MTDGYDCCQNALSERTNGILRQEFLFVRCNNAKEQNRLIRQSVEIYNHKRPHLALKVEPPNFIHTNNPRMLTSEGCKNFINPVNLF